MLIYVIVSLWPEVEGDELYSSSYAWFTLQENLADFGPDSPLPTNLRKPRLS